MGSVCHDPSDAAAAAQLGRAGCQRSAPPLRSHLAAAAVARRRATPGETARCCSCHQPPPVLLALFPSVLASLACPSLVVYCLSIAIASLVCLLRFAFLLFFSSSVAFRCLLAFCCLLASCSAYPENRCSIDWIFFVRRFFCSCCYKQCHGMSFCFTHLRWPSRADGRSFTLSRLCKEHFGTVAVG